MRKEKIPQSGKWKIINSFSLILQALGCAVLYFFIEAISRHSIMAAWSFMNAKPLVFAYNAGLIFTTMLVAYLSRRRTFWRLAIGGIWLFLGVLNGVILSTRVTPFTGTDLHMLTDGLSIANKYLPPALAAVAIVLFVAAVLFLLSMLVKGPKYRGKLKYRYNLPLVLAAFLAFGGITHLALEKRVLSNYF